MIHIISKLKYISIEVESDKKSYTMV